MVHVLTLRFRLCGWRLLALTFGLLLVTSASMAQTAPAHAADGAAGGGWLPTLDPVRLLEVGLSGFGFLMAFLAYRQIDQLGGPNPAKEKLIRQFMIFAAALFIGLMGLQILGDRSKVLELQTQLNALVDSQDALQRASGTIMLPAQGGQVGDRFASSGSISGAKPGDKVHFWLATLTGDNLYPKDSEIRVDGHGKWSSTIYEQGDAPQFSLLLIAVDENTHERMRAWIRAGMANHSKFDSFPRPYYHALSRIELRHVSDH